ncbi:MAG: hypothetical protein H6536_01615 [Bacteroidales bacterium]|nr:hypothetical protein [Bacteroidales bacterium]
MIGTINYIRLHLSILVCCVAFCTNFAVAQEVDYEELFAKLPSLTPMQAYTQLFAYQQQNPYFANTYIQLGRISELKLMEIDPLRNLDQAQYWVGNAVLFYNLFPIYLKESDVRRNREYYANIITPEQGKKIEYDDVMLFHKQRLAFCQAYKDSVTIIFRALATSKEYYNNSVQIFRDLNNSFRNLNVALLRTDDAFLQLLDSLNAQFASAIDSFRVYQALIQKFPLAGYDQQFTLRPIETFRLDGITNSDFLSNQFTLWDYSGWVSRYKQVYTADIVPLRKSIADIQDLFDSNRRKLGLLDSVSVADKFYSLDDLFLFRLGKYDNNSLVRDLFGYRQLNQNLLITSKMAVNSYADSSSTLMGRKMRYYYRLLQEYSKAKNGLSVFEQSVDSEKVANHKAFFSKYYGGLNGLPSFVDRESEFMQKLMAQSFGNLRQYIRNESALRLSYGYSEGRPRIPQSPNCAFVTGSSGEPYVVYSVSYIDGQPTFASGYANKPGRKPSAFVARFGADATTDWVKGVPISPALPQGDCARLVAGSANGCVAMVTAPSADSSANQLVRLDARGGMLFKKMLSNGLSPCFLQFDDISQNTLIALGQPLDSANRFFTNLSLNLVDSLGNSTWNVKLPVEGELVEVVTVGDCCVAFLNYQNYSDSQKQTIDKPGLYGHIMVAIGSASGEISYVKPVELPEPFTVSKVYSLSSSEIALVGQTPTSVANPDGGIVFIVVNGNGDVLQSYY